MANTAKATSDALPASPNSAVAQQLLENAPQVSGLQVIVKQETPFLPKVAFVLISLASLAGTTFTGIFAGLDAIGIATKWIGLWAIALAGGFAVWRVCYLRISDRDAAQAAVDALNRTALQRARFVGRWVIPVAILGAIGPLLAGYLSYQPILQWTIFAGMVALAVLLGMGTDRRPIAIAIIAVSLVVILTWSYTDAGAGWEGWVRGLHLIAFTLWLGGALWNIGVAMPAGRAHPNVDAVVAGAHQLDRFRWVVRFSLPTIIITGLIMAGAYRMLPLEWWFTLPGILIPLKVLAIIALVVVFITCPLFRHCSPVQGVCNIDDLGQAPETDSESKSPTSTSRPNVTAGQSK